MHKPKHILLFFQQLHYHERIHIGESMAK